MFILLLKLVYNKNERKVVNDVANNSSNEKLIRLLEVQLAHANQQNQELLKQVKSLSQQIHHPSKI